VDRGARKLAHDPHSLSVTELLSQLALLGEITNDEDNLTTSGVRGVDEARGQADHALTRRETSLQLALVNDRPIA
jgi:hypothetical protein